MQDRNDIIGACLIVLTDTLYLPGTKRLVKSFFEHNSPIPVIALSDDSRVFEDAFFSESCDRCVTIDLEVYADIRNYKKRHSKRHARTFYKFEAFRDYGFERNIFIDSDIVCLGPAPMLFEQREASLMAARDTGFSKTRNYKGSSDEINSGVLVIDRELQGDATVGRLSAIARDRPGRGGYDAGDQGIVNKLIREYSLSVTLLPEEYNLIKKDYADLSDVEQCRLLHFAGRKPWFPAKGKGDRDESLLRYWQPLPEA